MPVTLAQAKVGMADHVDSRSLTISAAALCCSTV